jgi:soluble lytic murein transglycosylase-like protein
MSDSTYDVLINKYAQLYMVPAALVKAVISVESNFDPYAKNPDSTASGLMQLIKGTADWVSSQWNISFDWTQNRFDPAKNIELGTRYLAYQLNRYGGSIPDAISAYYSGTANSDPENQSYVSKVLSKFNFYSDHPSGAGPAGFFPSLPAGSSLPDGGSGDSGGGTDNNMLFWAVAGVLGFIFLRRVL